MVGTGQIFRPERDNTARTSLSLGTGSHVIFDSLTLQGPHDSTGLVNDQLRGALTTSILIGHSRHDNSVDYPGYPNSVIRLDSELSGTQHAAFKSLHLDEDLFVGDKIEVGYGQDLIKLEAGELKVGAAPSAVVTLNNGKVDANEVESVNVTTTYLTSSVVSSSYIQLEDFPTPEDYHHPQDGGNPLYDNTLFAIDGGLFWNNFPIAGGTGLGGQSKTNFQLWGGNLYSQAIPPALEDGIQTDTFVRIGVSGSNVDGVIFNSTDPVERG